MNFGFNKSCRLLKANEFEETLRTGKKIVSPKLIVYGQPTTGDKGARLGLIVSKKVGKAVVRNRVKRSLRESFRLQKSAYAGLDIVVIARHGSAHATHSDIAHSFGHCLSRLKQQVQSGNMPTRSV